MTTQAQDQSLETRLTAIGARSIPTPHHHGGIEYGRIEAGRR